MPPSTIRAVNQTPHSIREQNINLPRLDDCRHFSFTEDWMNWERHDFIDAIKTDTKMDQSERFENKKAESNDH